MVTTSSIGGDATDRAQRPVGQAQQQPQPQPRAAASISPSRCVSPFAGSGCLCVGGCLQPGTAHVVVCLAVVTLPPRSTAPTVAGCCLVGCSVSSGRPLRSRAVAEVSQRVCVCLGPVLAFHAPSLPAAAAAAWRGRGRVPMAGWSYGGVGPGRGLRGGGRGGWCEEWARRG